MGGALPQIGYDRRLRVTRRQFLAAGLTLAGAYAAWPARSESTRSNRAAVVVGVNQVGDLIPLRAACSGAVAVADWLKAEGLDVTLIVDNKKPVLVADLKAAIKSLVDRGTLDQLVIYFAGHGFVGATGSEFWLLSNALQDPNEAVTLNASREYARRFGIKNVVFISDACRSLATSLGLAYTQGAIIFPTPTGGSQVRCDVDKFLATRIGDPAWEVPVDKSTKIYKGIYTNCLLEAFKRPYASIVVAGDDGKPVVPNRRLRDYLEIEVPKMAHEVNITLNQTPDAEICSDEPRYIAHVTTTERLTPSGTRTPTFSDVATSAIGVELGGGSQIDTQGTPAAEAFHTSEGSLVIPRGVEEFVERTGFVVSGARLASVTTRPEVVTHFDNSSRGYAFVNVDVRTTHGASVALRFTDGTGTVLFALDEFVGNVVVNQGSVASFALVPSRNNWRRSAYESEREKIEKLHAAVATAARYGVFRIEGPASTREKASAALAARIRMEKGIDPTLGLYAAYAYDNAGITEEVRSVLNIMRGDLEIVLFDVAMLAGELAGQQDRLYPFCPMLSQGWDLLRTRNVRLLQSVASAADHLLRSLWTMLDPQGMEIVIGALMRREVI